MSSFNGIRKQKFAILLLAGSVLAGALAGMVYSTVTSDRIASGVTIAGVDIGGLTERDAVAKISPTVKEMRSRLITLKIRDIQRRATLSQLGMSPEAAVTVAKAHKIGRDGNFIQRFIVMAFRAGAGKKLPVSIAFDLAKLDASLNRIGREVESPHKDATLTIKGGAPVIEPDVPGIKLDIGKCAQDVTSSNLEGQSPAVYLSLIEDKADVTADDLKTIDAQLSSFTTRFPAWKINRTHNIHLAVSALDGTFVKPSEVFSFNKSVGPRLKALGYREAPIFVHGELVPGTGGGVCQLSSTTYNAALLANMEIIQRSHHAATVPYVPPGRDATVVYGLRDLQFRNLTGNPVYISASIGGNRLTVAMYGSEADRADVEIVRSKGVRLPHKLVATRDDSLPLGARVTKKGYAGYSVSTYRIVKRDGVVVKRELISKDLYRPMATRVIVGPEPAPQAKRTTEPETAESE